MKPADLRHWRLHHHISQADLAELLGIDHMTVSRWERGTRGIPPYLQLTIRGLECLNATNHGENAR